MSWWTEVFLAATSLDDHSSSDEPECYPAIEFINKWLDTNSQGRLFPVRPNNDWQHHPTSCFAGNFNHLNRDGFVAAVRSAPWRWKEQVQLFVRQEDDKGFVPVNLNEN